MHAFYPSVVPCCAFCASAVLDILEHMRKALCSILLMLVMVVVVLAQEKKKSVWEGAYTDEQAERGHKAYDANCGGCHQADLQGKGEFPALKGDGFMERWHDYSIKPLFDLIRTEMPPLRFRTPDTMPLPDNV